MWILTTDRQGSLSLSSSRVAISLSIPCSTHPSDWQELPILRQYVPHIRKMMYHPRCVVLVQDYADGSWARRVGEALLQQIKLFDADVDVHLVGIEQIDELPTTPYEDEDNHEGCIWCDSCITCEDCSGEHFEHEGHTACDNCGECRENCDDCECAWCDDCEELYSGGHSTCEICGKCAEDGHECDETEGS